MYIDRAIDKFFEPFAELSSFIFYEIKIFDQDFDCFVVNLCRYILPSILDSLIFLA